MGVQGLAEIESGREINGSRPSEGAQRATGDQIQQKPSRNFISGPVSPLRNILGGLKAETVPILTRIPYCLHPLQVL